MNLKAKMKKLVINQIVIEKFMIQILSKKRKFNKIILKKKKIKQMKPILTT